MLRRVERSPRRDRKRTAARVAAHEALVRAQLDSGSPADEIAALVLKGDRSSWPEVAVVARYTQDLLARRNGGEAADGSMETIWHLAKRSGDPALLALALSHRARVHSAGDDLEQAALADADLAAAVVLLERGVGGSLERILAHIECAISFGFRHFWELERDQYDAARSIDPSSEEPDLVAYPDIARWIRWAPAYNLVELETRWACALSVIGDVDGQRLHATRARKRLSEAEAIGLPAEWLGDLRLMVLLARAVQGENVVDEASELARDPNLKPDIAGAALTALAVALSPQSPLEAAAAAEAAILLLETVTDPTAIDLALSIAAEAEGSPAGLRFGRVQAQRRWTGRRSSLQAMEATLHNERLRGRTEELERHAHLDALTGLSNRRGFARYLAGLTTSVSPSVAIVAVDVDRFKLVNDTYGHSAGDELLIRLGGVLATMVRSSDLAARLGGDEFVLLLDGVTAETASARATSILEAVAAPSGRELDGPSAAFGVSIGVATGHPADVEHLVAAADRALYEAKSLGGGRAVVAAAATTPEPATEALG